MARMNRIWRDVLKGGVDPLLLLPIFAVLVITGFIVSDAFDSYLDHRVEIERVRNPVAVRHAKVAVSDGQSAFVLIRGEELVQCWPDPPEPDGVDEVCPEVLERWEEVSWRNP